MKILKIPLEALKLNETTFKIVCPENMLFPIDMGHLETVFLQQFKISPCSTPYAKTDKNGRTYSIKAIKENIRENVLLIDGIGNVERIKTIKPEGKGYSSDPVSIPYGYNYDPETGLILHKEQRKALFFVLINGVWNRTYRKMPDNQDYKPPDEIPQVGCPESSKRVYTKLTDTVKKEKAEKEAIKYETKEQMEKRYEGYPTQAEKSIWRRIIDFILSLLKKS